MGLTRRAAGDWAAYHEAAKLTTAAVRPLGASWGRTLHRHPAVRALFFQAGGEYFDADGAATFGSDAGVRALEYLMSFYEDDLSSVNDVYSGSGAVPIVTGDAGLVFSGISALQNAEQNDASALDQIVFGMPLSDSHGGTPVTCSWVNKLAISAHTQDPDGAWQLLTHLTSGTTRPLMAAWPDRCPRARTPRATSTLPASPRSSWQLPSSGHPASSSGHARDRTASRRS